MTKDRSNRSSVRVWHAAMAPVADTGDCKATRGKSGRDKTGMKKDSKPIAVRREARLPVAEHRDITGTMRGMAEASKNGVVHHKWYDGHSSFDDGPINGTWKGYQPNKPLARFIKRDWKVL